MREEEKIGQEECHTFHYLIQIVSFRGDKRQGHIREVLNSAASMTRHRQLEAWASCSRLLRLQKHRGCKSYSKDNNMHKATHHITGWEKVKGMV